MKATARRGGCAGVAVDLPAAKTRKKRKDGGGGFAWGCGGSKSVSVVVGKLSTATAPEAKPPSSATALAKQQPPATTAVAPVVPREAESAPSVDALLRQLRELERGVRALGVRDQEGDCGDARDACRCSGSRRPPPPRRHQHHRRGASEVFGGSAAGVAAASASARRGRLEEESVAVVTETEDPLGEFRRSMAEMVVENGIRGGAELRELLQRFLSLNSARHHHLILIAFADVWEELFAAGRPVVPRHPPTKPRLSPPPDVSTSS